MKAVEFLWIPWERARNFAGRAWLFEVVANWLNSSARSMVIVGSPGSGKSAIAVQAARSSLGQADAPYERLHKDWLAATHFCDSYRSETLDPSLFVQSVIRQFSVAIPGFADAARSAALNLTGTPVNVTATVTAGTIHPGATVVGAEVGLRGYTAGEMASRILGEALRSLDLPIRPVVLVDGIDEATAFPTDMTMMDLLTGPAFQDLPIRLLLTSRPADFMHPPGTWVVDLDTEVAHGYADVHEYVRQCLVSTVPRHQLDLLSDSLSSASGGNFLYAYHVAGALLAKDPAGAAPHIWAASLLPSGLAKLYDGFRRRTIAASGSEDRKRYWRTVLRPVLALLAVAQGDGLTRHQLQVISGLNGDAVSDALEDLSEFLQFGDATAPIRVFHNSFREYLITGPGAGPPIIDADAAHAKIAMAALRQAREHAGAPGIGWEHADGYYMRYLPAHARRAGMLPDLLADVGFVAFMEPYGLLSAIESLDELPAEALAYRQVFPELLGDDVGLRLSYLDIAYHIYMLEGQIRRLAEFPVRRPWACRWTRTRPSMHRRSLVGHEHEVTAIAGAQVAGKFVVVSGDNAGYIMIWDAATGALLRRYRGHDASIVGLAVVRLGEGPVLVSGAKDCTLRRWDFETLAPLGVFSAELDPPNGDPRESLITSDGGRRALLMRNGMSNQAEGPVAHLFQMSAVRSVSAAGLHLVVTAGEDATVRGWDAESTTAIFESGGFRQGVEALDATAFRDTVFIAAASYLDVKVWELSTRKGYALPREFRFNVRTLAFTRIGEDLALLTPGRGTGASLWNVRTGELVRELPAPSRVTLLAGTAHPSRPCLIAALPDGRIRVWGQEPDTWQDLYGHNSAIRSIAVTEVDGGPVILSGGADRSVRVWDPPRHPEPTQAAVTHVWTLRTADVEGRAAVVASSITGSVSVYDMASGKELHRFRGHAKEVYKSCLATGEQGLALVSAGDDGHVRVWDARNGGLIHRFNGRRCLDRPLDLTHLGGKVIAFFITRGGVVGADINSGAILYEFEVPTSRFTTVAAVSTSTDTFVVALDRETLVAWSCSDRSLVQVDACTLPASKLTATSCGDQMVIVLGYQDGHVESWNQATGEHTMLTGHAAEMTSMSAAFAGPNLVVATSAGARDVRISASGVLYEIRMTGDVSDLAVYPLGAVAVGTTDGVTCIDPTTPAQVADPVSAARNGAGTAIVELQSASPVRDEQVFDPRGTDLIDKMIEESGHNTRLTGSPLVLRRRDLNEAIEQYGPKHPVVARALTRIARQFAVEGRTAEALSALTNALSMADKIVVPKVDLAEVLELTASLNRRDGNLDAALQVLRRLAAIYGEDSAHAALLGKTLTRVVEVLIETDRPEEARTTLPSALAALVSAYGADHQVLSESLHRVASACAQHGDVQGAIGYLQQALAIDDRRSPSGDRQTRESLLDLAWLTQLTDSGHTGDDHEALVLLNRALAVSQHACGAKSEEVVDVLELLALLLARTGSQDQAIAFLEQSIAIESEGQLVATRATTSRLSQLTGLLLDRGPVNQAADVARRLLVASEAVHGPESVKTVLALNQYGVALLLIGDLEGARASLERAMRLLQQSQDASEEMRQAVEHNLAAVIHQVGIADAAQAPNQQRHTDTERIAQEAPNGPDS